MSTIGQDLFLMFCDSHAPLPKSDLAFLFAPPTLHQRATQQQLAEVLEGEPRPELMPADVNLLAAEWEERFTEGRVHRHNFRVSPHGD